jgi:hypothetical protein
MATKKCYTTGQPVIRCPCDRCTRKVAKYIAFCIRPCPTCRRVYDSRSGNKTRCDQCSEAQRDRLTKHWNIGRAQSRWASRRA